MSDKNKTPLDYDEVVDKEKEKATIAPTQRKFQNLEIVPLILLAIGITMRNNDFAYSTYFLFAGGFSSAIIYGFFSWYMFSVDRYRTLEVILSVLCGLIFPAGILGILARYEGWKYGEELMSAALYGGVGLIIVSIVLFIFHLKDKRASTFYRNLIARLLIFTVLILQFNQIF